MWRFNSSLGPLKPLFFIHRSLHHDTHFQNAGPLCSLLHSRSVIRFAGPDTVKFLQGLLTNDVRRFGEPVDEMLNTVPMPSMPSVSVSPMYAALLTPQGRFLYDFFLYKPPRPVEKLDSTGSDPGSGLDGSVELFADVDHSVLDELLQTLKTGIFPSAPLVEADKETDEENYVLWRVEKEAAEGSIEIPKGEAISLEYNLFLNDNGKEVEEKVVPGSEVIDSVSGKKVGTATMAFGCGGMGVLRLDEVFKAGSLIIQGREDVKIDTIRPEWWPSDWYQDHQQHQHGAVA
ncbi:hypothetical protein SLA2020_498810 [Shorea laevis]